jgi:hypothetical protein
MIGVLAILAALGWSEWLAIAAFALSVVSLSVSIVFKIRADRRAGAAEKRDASRFAREQSAQRANLVLQATGTSKEGLDRRLNFYGVRNRGTASADAIRAWLVNEEGTVVSEREPPEGFALSEGEESQWYAVTTGLEELSSLIFWLEWTDDAGHHEEPTGKHPTAG